jgi:CRP-like cAMP-binding protein
LLNDTNLILHGANELLHNLQYERGCSTLFLDSRGCIFADRLAERRTTTDVAAKKCLALFKAAENTGEMPKLSLTRLADLRRRIGELATLRYRIDNLDMTYTAAVNAYTFEFNMPLIDTIGIVAHECGDYNSALVSAFSYFLQWKERVGRERALGARGFHSFAFRNSEFWDRMVALMSEAQTYLGTFISLASPRQIEIVKSALESREMQAIKEMLTLLEKASPPASIERFTADEWFNLLSAMLEQLHIAECSLIDGLVDGTGDTQIQRPGLGANGPGISRLRPYVRSLPLFANLGEVELNELLTHAQIRDYPRGKFLFLQGEQAQRMYIIISGWVKVYNGLESGEETILQMLTSGDTLLEAAVFLNTATPVSAQIIDDATLLSIPAPVIRQRINKSNALAVNMLNNISLRSQMLIHQIEQNRLKDARARVGWFLLRLHIAQGSEDGVIRLPYDKSTIASYLDMRPETFSRVLKKMRAEGLDVQNETIKLKTDKLLCEFCDNYIARDCHHAGDPECLARDQLDFDKSAMA